MADTPDLFDHNDIIRHRYTKVQALRDRGTAPYPTRWLPTHASDVIRQNADALQASQENVRVAGRLMTVRHMGKASFFNLKDQGGRIQVYMKRDDLPAEDYELFKELIDLGDVVGVEGFVFTTRTGELSIHAKSFTLLTKSVRPLPEKWHGLRDVETRYRQRYVDLITNDSVFQTFATRSRMITTMRNFLTGRGYLEVETPMMHPLSGGATAKPFTTHHNALDMELYLRIAPELYLKRLTVGGMERTFEINRNFRNEGLSMKHNPEFTMLELYTAYWDYTDTMALTEEMLRRVATDVFGDTKFTFGEHAFDLGQPIPRVTYLDAIRQHVPGAEGVALSWADSPADTLAKVSAFHRPDTTNTTHGILTEIFEHRVETHLVAPIFVTEFAKAVSPLAKSKPDDPAVAERFELYMCGMEVANGYSELNDPAEQYERFREQVEAKAKGDDEANDMDEDYIRALEYGMPPTSGLGVGIDRLTMLLTNSPTIRDVILFPLMRPEARVAPSFEDDGEDEPPADGGQAAQ